MAGLDPAIQPSHELHWMAASRAAMTLRLDKT
jgi:hypothetical protein